MKIVGITGGIGSGKTTVCKILSVFNIPVYYADMRAKELYDEDSQLKKKVVNLFGTSVYSENGLNRAEVAQRVFNNKELLHQLNSIVHPVVEKDFLRWLEKYPEANFVVKEAAILFENDGYKKLAFNVLVTAPEDIRIRRVIKRDGVLETQVRARIKNQWPDEKKIPLADCIIKCDEDNLVIPQVMTLVRKVKSL